MFHGTQLPTTMRWIWADGVMVWGWGDGEVDKIEILGAMRKEFTSPYQPTPNSVDVVGFGGTWDRFSGAYGVMSPPVCLAGWARNTHVDKRSEEASGVRRCGRWSWDEIGRCKNTAFCLAKQAFSIHVHSSVYVENAISKAMDASGERWITMITTDSHGENMINIDNNRWQWIQHDKHI